jgi:hypothetical protein
MISEPIHKSDNSFIKIAILVSSLCLTSSLMLGCRCFSQRNPNKKPVREHLTELHKKSITEPITEEHEVITESKISMSNQDSTPLFGNSVSGYVEIKLNKSPNAKPYKTIANVVVRAFQWRPPIVIGNVKKSKKNTPYITSAWQLVGETTTNNSGYYSFVNVITPGYPTFIEVTSMHRPANPRFPKVYIIANPELSFAKYGGGADKQCLMANKKERAKEARSKDPKTCSHVFGCKMYRDGDWWLRYDDNDCIDNDADKNQDAYYREVNQDKDCKKLYERCNCIDIYTPTIKKCLRTHPSETRLTYKDKIIYVIRKDIAGKDVNLTPVPGFEDVTQASNNNNDFSPNVNFTVTNDDLDAGTKATEAVITSEDWYKPEGYIKPYYGYPSKHKIGTSVLAIMRLINRIFIDNFDATTLKGFYMMSENIVLDLHYFPDLDPSHQSEEDIDPNSVQKYTTECYSDDPTYSHLHAFLIPTMHLNRAYGYQYPKQLINILCCSGRYGNGRPFPGRDVSFCPDQSASCKSRHTPFSSDKNNGYSPLSD